MSQTIREIQTEKYFGEVFTSIELAPCLETLRSLGVHPVSKRALHNPYQPLFIQNGRNQTYEAKFIPAVRRIGVHSLAVTVVATAFAEILGFTAEEKIHLQKLALLHDADKLLEIVERDLDESERKLTCRRDLLARMGVQFEHIPLIIHASQHTSRYACRSLLELDDERMVYLKAGSLIEKVLFISDSLCREKMLVSPLDRYCSRTTRVRYPELFSTYIAIDPNSQLLSEEPRFTNSCLGTIFDVQLALCRMVSCDLLSLLGRRRTEPFDTLLSIVAEKLRDLGLITETRVPRRLQTSRNKLRRPLSLR